jgi:predicted CXXCH cytochrome family protein
VMTTGSHHLQGYWVPSHKGSALHQLPFVFDLHDKRWIPVQDEFLTPPSDRRRFAVWNNSCIQCHAVAGQPGLNQRTDELWSSVAEFGIACESCHGPGAQHVARHTNPVERYQQHFTKAPDPTIVNPAHLDHRRSSQICGQCHSTFAPTDEGKWYREGYAFRAGDSLEDSQHHFTFDRTRTEKGEAEFAAQGFWPDGSNRVGGREYLAMTESACFQRGELSCLSCHSMHRSEPDDQLAIDKRDNRACLPCHQDINARLEQHTHHAPNSSGSSCYNCHMPHTSFALMKAIRAHSINSPRITQESASTAARPNACNLCHIDQTLSWTQRWLHEWYGQAIEPLPEEASQHAASVRWMLKGDAVQRVVTAWHFGWTPALEVSGRDWPAVLLTNLLDDPYAVVRAVAFRSLRVLLPTETLEYDFVAPTEQRQQAQARLLDRASRQFSASKRGVSDETSRSELQWRHLLLAPDGQLLLDDLRRLIRARDDRDLELPE